MTVSYKGMDKDFGFRLAEIFFDAEDPVEAKAMDYLVELMNSNEYPLNIVSCGYAICIVEDRDEYKDFVKVYKKNKRVAKVQVKLEQRR